uniref:Uncharacterized protein n=1 Tax=Anguilla anguilla TaxID=7936 RepID=A0A0E9WE38_ANGAN
MYSQSSEQNTGRRPLNAKSDGPSMAVFLLMNDIYDGVCFIGSLRH